MSFRSRGNDGPAVCEKGGGGLIFPLIESEQEWPSAMRAILYGIALLYLFLGVNIVSDRFMGAIETITSKKLRKRDKKTGRLFTMMKWNDTIANLTLLAVGSSAPEILLSFVEVGRGDFHMGIMGPSTIVGSAAFNLFVIVGVCVCSIPSPETRHVKQTGVFALTAVFSLLLYIWVVLIVQWSSPDIIDVWEAAVTVSFLPVLVVLAWLVDIGWFAKILGLSREEDGELEDAGQTEKQMLELDDEEEESEGEGSDGGSPKMRHKDPAFDEATLIRDELFQPIVHPPGILTFASDTMEVEGSEDEQKVTVQVFRRNGAQGAISCKYHTERLSAVPEYDYEEQEGELIFEEGETEAEIVVGILPKKAWEYQDEFQLILADADGGAMFNPLDDGGEDCGLLTITILNKNSKGKGCFSKVVSVVDRMVNIDEIRFGNKAWRHDIVDVLFDINGTDYANATRTDWVIYAFALPWQVCFTLLIPPTPYWGGWISFVSCLGYIGVLAAIVLDFAELFGCVAGIKDAITAITFVALGCSMPDIFVSKIAALNDEFADASIVNVTGSNCINVILGIGLPWLIACIYWKQVGATDDWKRRYPQFVASHPDAAFVVEAGDLSFSVIVFIIGAFFVLGLLRLRRLKFGGELGGPFKSKVISTMLLFGTWVVYILLSIWKMAYNMDDIGPQVKTVLTIENFMFVLGVLVNIAFTGVSLSDFVDKFSQ